MKNILIIAIILLLVSWTVLFVECRRNIDPLVITTVDTIPGDSVPYPVEIIIKEPVPVYRDTGSVRWREMEIDTQAILVDYFAKNHYLDTLMNDTSAFISLKSHVHQNRLFYDELMFQNRRATAIVTHTQQILPPGRFYLGTGAGRNPHEFDVPVSALYAGKRNLAYSVQYGLLTGDLHVLFYFQIK